MFHLYYVEKYFSFPTYTLKHDYIQKTTASNSKIRQHTPKILSRSFQKDLLIPIGR